MSAFVCVSCDSPTDGGLCAHCRRVGGIDEIERLREVARHYLEDAARWEFDGPGVQLARAALAAIQG